MNDTSQVPTESSEPDDGAKEIHPFHTIQRGQDTTVGRNSKVVFSDFRSKVILNTVPTVDDLDPKDSSVQVHVPSSESNHQTEETTETKPVQTPVPKGSGKTSQTESGKQTSS